MKGYTCLLDLVFLIFPEKHQRVKKATLEHRGLNSPVEKRRKDTRDLRVQQSARDETGR
jgi:hypothetical protein